MPSVLPSDTGHGTRAGDLAVWLGGGNAADIADHQERSTYQHAGLIVLLNALAAWGVAAAVVLGVSAVSPVVALQFTLVFGLIVGVFSRVLASGMAERGKAVVLGDLLRGAVAVVLGLVVGELAALAVFSGPIDAELGAKVDAARAAVSQSERAQRLEQVRADRAQLDEKVNAAVDRRDEARVVARCEVNPGPQCPSAEITGDAGRGPEANQAEVALADAERDLAEARSERDGQAPRLREEIGALESALDADRAKAVAAARADTGVDARWQAMHAHTTDNTGALVMRVGVDGFFVLLSVLPLLLRLWRGQTVQDRRVLARRKRLYAEEEAQTAIALERAHARARTEIESIGSPRPEPEPEPRTLTAVADRANELPQGAPASEPEPSDNLPVPVGRGELEHVDEREVTPRRSSPLDILPGPLPGVARALTGVAKASVNPVRSARTVLEEVDELRVSLTRRRTVTVEPEEPEQHYQGVESESERARLRHSAVATRIADQAGQARDALTEADSRQAVTGPDDAVSDVRALSQGPRALPRGGD